MPMGERLSMLSKLATNQTAHSFNGRERLEIITVFVQDSARELPDCSVFNLCQVGQGDPSGRVDHFESIARKRPEKVDDLVDVPGLRRWQIAEMGSEFVSALAT